MKALLGIVLAVAAVAGGQLIAHSLDHAIDAPQKRFDAAADARIAQLRNESAERRARELAELERQLAGIIAGLERK
jgi:hypothetical protein